MSSNLVAITARNLSKIYQIYEKPTDRLKQFFYRVEKKYYREFNALQKINFEINSGETVGIIGVNGSGKSTLLQILAGTLHPTTGEIQVNGRVAALLELGSGFNPEFTGRENVYLNGSILGVSKEEMENRFQEIEKFADIGEFIDQPVKTYSSGMYVRLAFAVAINVDADILIIDEALAVGDVFFQAKCYRKFEEYKKKGKTILLVTHDLGSIIKYCDNVILLNKGELVDIGEAKEIVDTYKKILVKSNTQDTMLPNKQSEITQSNKWLDLYDINSAHLNYGNGYAKIIDFGIFDEFNQLNSQVDKNSTCTLKMRVRFEKEVAFPIFAFTLKDLKGTEITGTNTMIEGELIPVVPRGETIEISFKQKVNLQGGNYLLSLGCTGFENNEFVVYNRLYDIISLQVISIKNTVGFFDLNSKIEISTIN